MKSTIDAVDHEAASAPAATVVRAARPGARTASHQRPTAPATCDAGGRSLDGTGTLLAAIAFGFLVSGLAIQTWIAMDPTRSRQSPGRRHFVLLLLGLSSIAIGTGMMIALLAARLIAA